ncbi:MAG: hypothetical protein JMDDDDMK_01493 [Acidobacteria bacterium]|nr:hypothetical protein [Acidobacteriota bacterium]
MSGQPIYGEREVSMFLDRIAYVICLNVGLEF